MNTAAIAPADRLAIKLALEYWVAHWDFECPSLFGIELAQMQEVLLHWPSVPTKLERTAALAVLGALRELLHGASAVPGKEVSKLIGLSYEQAHDLCSKVHAVVRPVLEHESSSGAQNGT
jgi:hypothetical protein